MQTFKIFLSFVFFLSMFSSDAQPSNKIKIVALGDSTTAGTPGFRSPAEIPPQGQGNRESQYAYWMMKNHPQWDVINRGINSERSDQILQRFVTDVLPYEPDVVIVLAGVNDLFQGRSVDELQSNLKELYRRTQEAGFKLMVCTILPYNNASPSVRVKMAEVNRWIKTYAQENGFGFCDTYQAVEDPSKPGYLLESPDGYHPNVQTYKKMGESIAEALDQYLKNATIVKKK